MTIPELWRLSRITKVSSKLIFFTGITGFDTDLSGGAGECLVCDGECLIPIRMRLSIGFIPGDGVPPLIFRSRYGLLVQELL